LAASTRTLRRFFTFRVSFLRHSSPAQRKVRTDPRFAAQGGPRCALQQMPLVGAMSERGGTQARIEVPRGFFGN
jgi:hypothetical protein